MLDQSRANNSKNRFEQELLLCCVRSAIDPATDSRIRLLLQQDLDWIYLIKTANWQGVVPLLYRQMQSTYAEVLPRAILEKLKDEFQGNAIRNLFLASELIKLLNLFKNNNIAAVPYKGPVLAVAAYGDLALRQFADLDILVRQQDLPGAREWLSAQGYDLIFPYGKRRLSKLTRRQEASYLKSNHEYNFVRQDGLVTVDLHWKLTPRRFPLALKLDQLWDDLVKISLLGTRVPSFASEDLVLLLCIHGAKDQWVKLAWVCDIDHLIHAYSEIDWEKIIERAQLLRCTRTLLLGLNLANNLLGTPLVPRLTQMIRADKHVALMTRKVRARLFENNRSKLGLAECFDIKPLQIAAFERWRDKCRYVVDTVTTPTEQDWARLSLPDPLFATYYLLRPLRMGVRYANGLFKRLSQSQ